MMRRIWASAAIIVLAASTALVRPIGPEPGPVLPNPTGTASAVRPAGPGGNWSLEFDDEFTGSAVDTSKWSFTSSAEADGGQGNPDNQQLEWNQSANCSEAGGLLTITADRQTVTSPNGNIYGWTSCLLTTVPSFAFQYGYIETRAQFPPAAGFWPAFWTWQAGSSYIETDAFEYYSDNQNLVYLTQHSGAGGGCEGLVLGFNPTSAFHVYGVDIEPGGTTWWIDGKDVCSTPATSTGQTNIILDDFVYSQVPPDPSTDSATEQIDYVRAYAKVG